MIFIFGIINIIIQKNTLCANKVRPNCFNFFPEYVHTALAPPPNPQSVPLWIHLHSKDQGPKDIGHKMGIVVDTRKFEFWELVVFLDSYLVHYYISLQNATDAITKCNGYFTTKWDKSLLQNASAFLLKRESFNSKCDHYCKMR